MVKEILDFKINNNIVRRKVTVGDRESRDV